MSRDHVPIDQTKHRSLPSLWYSDEPLQIQSPMNHHQQCSHFVVARNAFEAINVMYPSDPELKTQAVFDTVLQNLKHFGVIPRQLIVGENSFGSISVIVIFKSPPTLKECNHFFILRHNKRRPLSMQTLCKVCTHTFVATIHDPCEFRNWESDSDSFVSPWGY